MGDRISYVGLDVYKDGIVVAIADGGLRGEIREYGRIVRRSPKFRKFESFGTWNKTGSVYRTSLHRLSVRTKSSPARSA